MRHEYDKLVNPGSSGQNTLRQPVGIGPIFFGDGGTSSRAAQGGDDDDIGHKMKDASLHEFNYVGAGATGGQAKKLLNDDDSLYDDGGGGIWKAYRRNMSKIKNLEQNIK